MTSDQRNYGTKNLISDLPNNIIEKILEFMPIQEAARTSILSADWRYKWTSLPQIRFDEVFFINHNNRDVVNIINEILLFHDGTIRKFSLRAPSWLISIHDLGRWMLFLSRVGVKEISLSHSLTTSIRNPIKLPSSFFSCQELTYLDLFNFIFELPRVFRGFKHLTTLYLNSVVIATEVLETLLSASPHLKILRCIDCPGVDHVKFHAPKLKFLQLRGQFKSIFVNQCPYLSVAFIELIRPVNIHEQSIGLVKIIDRWPRLKKLVIGYSALKIISTARIPKRVPARFDHLEHLHFHHPRFEDFDLFCSAFRLIRSAPNLQKLEILNPSFHQGAIQPIVNFMNEDFTDGCLNQLRTVRMTSICGNDLELELIKFLLSSSPVLQTMILETSSEIDRQVEKNLTRKLIQFSRVSPKAEVIYKNNGWKTR